MSGAFGSSQWMYASGAGSFYSYSIDQSLRFVDDSSTVLHRTPSSASNRKTWSFSCWIKLSTLQDDSSRNFSIFSAGGNVYNRRVDISIGSGYKLMFFMDGRADGASYYSFIADRLLRDTAAWMHIMAVMDTTDSTADDRLKLYVNGERQLGAYQYGNGAPPLNSDWYVNSTYEHDIGDGHHNTVTQFFDGYMAEVNFIDGTALDPTSFGETINGIWVPKQYSGSYGTNGFYLDFSDNSTASALGTDSSGNSNDFSVNNLATTDQVPDSPTNNFATLSPLHTVGGPTLSEGNLKLVGSGTDYDRSYATFGLTSGKWYAEFRYLSGDDRGFFGVVREDSTSTDASNVYIGSKANQYGLDFRARAYTNSTGLFDTTNFSTGDIGLLCFDIDNGKLWFGRRDISGSTTIWYDSAGANNGDPSAGTNPTYTGTFTGHTWFIGCHDYNGTNIHANFGADGSFAGGVTSGGLSDANGNGDFNYIEDGFLALCSANLPEPAIGPNSDTTSDEHFDTILYTAATSNGTYTHGNLLFRPDFSWIKNRNNVEGHYLIDVVRGNSSTTNTFLQSNGTAAEGALNATGTTFSVTDTGYEFVETSITAGELYYSGRTYVGWNWKAGGTAVSNTDGSITSSVSANPDAGFSIVGYTGDGTSGTRTIGCGLTKKPDLVIIKNRTEDGVTDSWFVYGTPLGSSSPSPYLTLYNTDAVASSGVFVDTSFSDNSGDALFAVSGSYDGVNKSGTTYIAYCFHSVEGYSKVGSYVGNGSADGTFVYTGFQPSLVLTKRNDSTSNWVIWDDTRNEYNVTNNYLVANSNAAEVAGSGGSIGIDILSNGFKFRSNATNWNASGGSYIFLCFASAPFKYSNAR